MRPPQLADVQGRKSMGLHVSDSSPCIYPSAMFWPAAGCFLCGAVQTAPSKPAALPWLPHATNLFVFALVIIQFKKQKSHCSSNVTDCIFCRAVQKPSPHHRWVTQSCKLFFAQQCGTCCQYGNTKESMKCNGIICSKQFNQLKQLLASF